MGTKVFWIDSKTEKKTKQILVYIFKSQLSARVYVSWSVIYKQREEKNYSRLELF